MSSLTPAQRAEITELATRAAHEALAAVRREMIDAAITRAVRLARSGNYMPCVVEQVGVTVEGVEDASLASVLADDNPETPIIATMVDAGFVVGDRGLLEFREPAGVYLFGPIPS